MGLLYWVVCRGALCFILPIFLGILADEMIYHQNIKDFTTIAGCLIFITVFWCILYFGVYMYFNDNYSKYVFDIKKDLFSKLERLALRSFDQIPNGDLINMIMNYSDECIFIIIVKDNKVQIDTREEVLKDPYIKNLFAAEGEK